jgi:hypothetical protein
LRGDRPRAHFFGMHEDDPAAPLVPAPPRSTTERRPDAEPPVVARLVVEIRSDGSRTIARGALEDLTTGERAAVEAHGTTPLALAASLSRAVFQLPALARRAARALLPGRRRP